MTRTSRRLNAQKNVLSEKIFLCVLCLLCVLCSLCVLSAQRPLAVIKEIRRTVLADAVRVTIELDGEVPFRDEWIADPSRVFVDLPGTRAATKLLDRTLRFESDADVVRQVRIGRHPN